MHFYVLYGLISPILIDLRIYAHVALNNMMTWEILLTRREKRKRVYVLYSCNRHLTLESRKQDFHILLINPLPPPLSQWEKVKVKAAQSSLTLFDSMGCILQARILEWVAVPFSRESFPPRDLTQDPTLLADTLPAEPQGNMPSNEEMVSFPFLFSQGKAT